MKQIDDISEQADHMEKLCLELDDYTKYLGKHTNCYRAYLNQNLHPLSRAKAAKRKSNQDMTDL